MRFPKVMLGVLTTTVLWLVGIASAVASLLFGALTVVGAPIAGMVGWSASLVRHALHPRGGPSDAP